MITLTLGKRVNNEISVYTVELLAILLALQWVEDTEAIKVGYLFRLQFSIKEPIQFNHSDSRPDIVIEVQLISYRIHILGRWNKGK